MGLIDAIRANRRFRKLQMAVDGNNPEEVGALLNSMKSDGLLNDFPEEMLLYACDAGERAECVGLLLEFGWKSALENTDGMGRAPLHMAVERGDIATVRILLNAGADPNARDRDGVTPLNLCKSFHGTAEMAELLRDAGGNPNLVDKHGKNYLM